MFGVQLVCQGSCGGPACAPSEGTKNKIPMLLSKSSFRRMLWMPPAAAVLIIALGQPAAALAAETRANCRGHPPSGRGKRSLADVGPAAAGHPKPRVPQQ